MRGLSGVVRLISHGMVAHSFHSVTRLARPAKMPSSSPVFTITVIMHHRCSSSLSSSISSFISRLFLATNERARPDNALSLSHPIKLARSNSTDQSTQPIKFKPNQLENSINEIQACKLTNQSDASWEASSKPKTVPLL